MTPTFSVIMPIYNVERFVAAAIDSVLAQEDGDFELLVVDDCSPDGSRAICEAYDDPRVTLITHPVNRGLAGARNTGVRAAQGRYLAFLDSDDIWEPAKLARHREHLEARPEVGLSFSRSAFIDADGEPLDYYQMPSLTDITPGLLFCRNPVGNGSAPVIRREILEAIAFDCEVKGGGVLPCYFDESLRQSEDIECWTRIALKTGTTVEGIPEPLTRYRLNEGGLSAQLERQYQSWLAIVELTRAYAPDFIEQWYPRAQAYQLRYLSRQAIRLRDGDAAWAYCRRAVKAWPGIWKAEFGRTAATAGAALMLRVMPKSLYLRCEGLAQGVIGKAQKKKIDNAPRPQSARPNQQQDAHEVESP